MPESEIRRGGESDNDPDPDPPASSATAVGVFVRPYGRFVFAHC